MKLSPAISTPILPLSWQPGEGRTLLVVIVICNGLAVLFGLTYPGTLKSTLLSANASGLGVWSIATLVRLFHRGRLPPWGLIIAIPAGNILGRKLASLFGAPDFLDDWLRDPALMGRMILRDLLIGVAITAFFLYYSHAKGVREQLERERRRATEALQGETAARLNLLQAQIEPHFLFNTLATIHSLIKEDPDKAGVMLEDLNAYLRTSLRRTRQLSASLADELSLIEALLAIATVRLGARLVYGISASQEVRAMSFPPLLLQPLVENAIRHGIEPAIAGGSIQVEVRRVGDCLEATVRDTGVGMKAESPPGVGLQNVRERLASLYGASASLALYVNEPHGMTAKLIVPLAGAAS
jgi:hypothetical protein